MIRQLLTVLSLGMLMVSVSVSPLAMAEPPVEKNLDWDVERDFVDQLQLKSNEVLKSLDDEWYQEMVDFVERTPQNEWRGAVGVGSAAGIVGVALVIGSLINNREFWDFSAAGISRWSYKTGWTKGTLLAGWGKGTFVAGVVLTAVGVAAFIYSRTLGPREVSLQELQQVVGDEMASQLVLVHKLLQELSDAWDRKGVALQIPNNLVIDDPTQDHLWRFPVRPDTRIVLGRTVDPAVAQQIEIRAGDFELLIQSSGEASTDYVKLALQDSQRVKVFVLSKIAEKYLDHLDSVAERAAAHHLYASEFDHPDAFLDSDLEVSFDEVLFLNDAALDGTVPAYGKITYSVQPRDLLDDDSSTILLRAAH